MRKLNKKISSLFVSGIESLDLEIGFYALEYDLGRHGRVSSPK